MVLEILQFENPEVLAIGIFIVSFIVSFRMIFYILKNKGPALIAALAISLLSAWKLYQERYYGWEGTLAILLIVIIVIIIGRIFWAFIRNARRSFGRY